VLIVGDDTFDPCRIAVCHTLSLSLLSVERVEVGAHCRIFALVWPLLRALNIGTCGLFYSLEDSTHPLWAVGDNSGWEMGRGVGYECGGAIKEGLKRQGRFLSSLCDGEI
jgi:hypothetical protein